MADRTPTEHEANQSVHRLDVRLSLAVIDRVMAEGLAVHQESLGESHHHFTITTSCGAVCLGCGRTMDQAMSEVTLEYLKHNLDHLVEVTSRQPTHAPDSLTDPTSDTFGHDLVFQAYGEVGRTARALLAQTEPPPE